MHFQTASLGRVLQVLSSFCSHLATNGKFKQWLHSVNVGLWFSKKLQVQSEHRYCAICKYPNIMLFGWSDYCGETEWHLMMEDREKEREQNTVLVNQTEKAVDTEHIYMTLTKSNSNRTYKIYGNTLVRLKIELLNVRLTYLNHATGNQDNSSSVKNSILGRQRDWIPAELNILKYMDGRDGIGQPVMVRYWQAECRVPPIIAEATYFHQEINFPPVYVYCDKDTSPTKRPNRAMTIDGRIHAWCTTTCTVDHNITHCCHWTTVFQRTHLQRPGST